MLNAESNYEILLSIQINGKRNKNMNTNFGTGRVW